MLSAETDVTEQGVGLDRLIPGSEDRALVDHVQAVVHEHGLTVQIQPDPRVSPDDTGRGQAGAAVNLAGDLRTGGRQAAQVGPARDHHVAVDGLNAVGGELLPVGLLEQDFDADLRALGVGAFGEGIKVSLISINRTFALGCGPGRQFGACPRCEQGRVNKAG